MMPTLRLFITFLLTNVALFAHPHIFVDIYPKATLSQTITQFSIKTPHTV